MVEKDESVSIGQRISLDSEHRSNADVSDSSGKGTPDPEKGVIQAEQDVEQPESHELPSKETATSTDQPHDPTLVEFDGPEDLDNPRNWTIRRRAAITVSMGLMTFVVTFSSSIFAVAIEPVAEEFNVGIPVATLGVSFFLLGFVLGPVAFGPASEVWGRLRPLISGYIVFAIFNIPVALGKNIETILIGRFIGGIAASAPIAVIGGCLADMWDPVKRTYAICAFASGTFCGPVAGPIVGGFVTESYLGWRWTAWFTLIMAGLFGTIGVLVIPETSPQRILQKRAKRLRAETGNLALHSTADDNPINLHTITHIYLKRPWVMIVQEPVLACMTAYMSYIYGVLYLLFEAFPISFHEERGWSLGISGLAYVPFIVGIMMGSGIMVYSTATNFKRAYIKYGRPIPEERLPPMIVGAVILPISFFWFAWTSFPSITWVPQIISVAFIGSSVLVTFWQGMSYIIDCYGFYSNSALVVNTFIRSIAAAVFPLFAPYMYQALGVRWATSLLAFLCVAFLPAPILFYKYGARIRQRSKFTPTG